MKIPRHWAKARYEGKDPKGRASTCLASGWSSVSLQEAREEAAARAKRVFECMSAGRKPERYAYPDRPIKEERVQEIGDGESPVAVITRNRYGALVLNCANALFVDVDFPPPRPKGLLDGILFVFGNGRRASRRRAAAEARIEQIKQWAARNPGRSFRLYRAREGLRLLFTDRLYDPVAESTTALLSELDAEYRKWEDAYAKCDVRFKVCELIRAFGSPADIDSLKTIVDVHDRSTRIAARAELA